MLTRNVEIHVLEHADKTRNVTCKITYLSAHVILDILVIHSDFVVSFKVSFSPFVWSSPLNVSYFVAVEIPRPEPQNPCQPSPCGPNSQCRESNGQAVCSCLPEYVGSPPNCRPECTVSSECAQNKACINQKCQDPCPGTCGINAKCSVINHSPICICSSGYTGDPFSRCYLIPRKFFQLTKPLVLLVITHYYSTSTCPRRDSLQKSLCTFSMRTKQRL